jgi:hypothetical protein
MLKMAKDFSLLKNVQIAFAAHPASYAISSMKSFPRLVAMAQGRLLNSIKC